ncbi:MAG: TPM domain-containing protein [Pseudomonadota bacterium]
MMLTQCLRFCGIVIFAVCLQTSLYAQDGTANDPYILDDAGVIDPETKERLGAYLLDQRTQGRRIAVHTIQTFDGADEERSLKGYTLELLTSWTQENPDHASTALLIVSVDQREAATAIGENYHAYYGERLDWLVLDTQPADFNARNISATIEQLAIGMAPRMVQNWQPEPYELTFWDRFLGSFSFGVIGVILLVVVVVIGLLRDRIAAKLVTYKRCPECGAKELTRTVARLREATYNMRGEELISTRCGNCGYERTWTRYLRAHRDANEPGEPR